MLKIMIVEDHALVRVGMANLLKQLDEDVAVTECGDAEAAMDNLDLDEDYDLLLLDLGLPEVDGFQLLDQLRMHYPMLPVVVVSAYTDEVRIGRAMRKGALGYITKSHTSDELLDALREVLAGNIYRPRPNSQPAESEQDFVVDESKLVEPSEFGLTERQAQVLAYMANGKSNKQIASELRISEGTVKIHITAIFKALNVN
ncbi:MAG: hypothetical protein RIR00_28, partial [Pseudomonadota bacterium]